MQNCLDFIRLNPTKKQLLCNDFTKYDLNSTGEYTQGAGTSNVAYRQSQVIHLKTIGQLVPKAFLISLNRTDPFKKEITGNTNDMGLK
jgi:hydroxymethylglutaryl-CoA synthase